MANDLRPEPGSAGPRIVWPAYLASAWGVAFALVHLSWLLGGTAGLPPGKTVQSNVPLLIIDVIAVPVCALAAVLGLAFVRPMCVRVSRRQLLTLGLLTVAVNFAHSVPSVVQLMIATIQGATGEFTELERFVLFLYEPWFFVGGVLFALATWCYWRGPTAVDRR